MPVVEKREWVVRCDVGDCKREERTTMTNHGAIIPVGWFELAWTDRNGKVHKYVFCSLRHLYRFADYSKLEQSSTLEVVNLN